MFATGPLEKRETPPDKIWRELRHILRRERTNFNISGAKAHANVLKGTFSADCESDCKRIGLSIIENTKNRSPVANVWFSTKSH